MFKKRLAVDLLKTFWQARNQPLHGYAIMDASGWSAGTMYPALMALEEAGLLTSKWEDRFAASPRRRVYEMTEAGADMATASWRKRSLPPFVRGETDA